MNTPQVIIDQLTGNPLLLALPTAEPLVKEVTNNPRSAGGGGGGSGGNFVIKSGDTMTGALQFSGNTNPGLVVNSLTTTQRNSVGTYNGNIIYNTTASQLQTYGNGQWTDISKSPATKVVTPSGSGYQADYYTTGLNDQTTINLALQALKALGGGTLLLTVGTFRVLTPGIAQPTNTIIKGMGFATVIVRDTGAAFPGTIHNENNNLTTGSGDTGLVLRDLMIDGNYRNFAPPGGPNWNNIQYTGVSDSLIDNVYVYDSPDSAIVFDYNNLPVYTNNTVIRNCVIDTTQDIGIYCSNPNSNIIQGNRVRNTNSYGIRVIRRTSNQAQSNQIIGNRVYNCGQGVGFDVDGITIEDADTTEIVGNYVRQSGRNGIRCDSAYCLITGNYSYESDAHGIYIDGGSRGVVTGNVVYRSSQSAGNTFSGIALNSASNMTVSGNRSGDSGSGTRQKYGIVELGSSDYNTITGNSVDRNGTAPVLRVGANTTVANNTSTTTPVDSYLPGNVGIGIASTARLHLGAGTATANTAPLKFTSGTSLTSPEAGAMEFDGTSFYLTPSSTRKTILFTDFSNASGTLAIANGGTNNSSAYTAGSVIYSDGTKLTQDNSNFFYDATNHRLGLGTTSPSELLHISKTTGNFTTVRFDSGTTQGYFFAYDGDPSVNFGSNSNTNVNIRVNNSTVATFTSAGLATAGTISSGTWNGTAIGVLYGGTGQTSYTDGQLLIGNTTGNTLAKGTLTGTSNQITVTNGSGSITLSTPQNIDSAASVTFDNLSLTHSGSGAEFIALTITNSAVAVNSDVSISFRPANLSTARAKIRAVAPGGSDAELAFYTSNNNASPVEQMRIKDQGQIQFTKTFSQYNSIATVSGGVPSELATIDSTGLTGNVAAATLYVVPASGEGLYRVSAYLVTTTAASVSSTMPNAQVVYTDKDSNTSVTLDVSPILGAAGLGQSGLLTANTVGTVFSGSVVIYVKASTTIQYQTVNYASTIAGMAYALHIKLEAL